MTYKELIQMPALEFNLEVMANVKSELVGSRFFGTDSDFSDYDYLIQPTKGFYKIIKKLEKEGKTFNINEYADFKNLLCSSVYILNVETYGQVHLILSNEFELYYNCFSVAKNTNLFKVLPKQYAMPYFNAFCNVKYYEKVLNKPILSV